MLESGASRRSCFTENLKVGHPRRGPWCPLVEHRDEWGSRFSDRNKFLIATSWPAPFSDPFLLNSKVLSTRLELRRT